MAHATDATRCFALRTIHHSGNRYLLQSFINNEQRGIHNKYVHEIGKITRGRGLRDTLANKLFVVTVLIAEYPQEYTCASKIVSTNSLSKTKSAGVLRAAPASAAPSPPPAPVPAPPPPAPPPRRPAAWWTR